MNGENMVLENGVEDQSQEGAIDDVHVNDGENSSSENEIIEEENQYNPNYKFKVRGEEFEFDEKIRPVISNREVEEHLRDLYTKSYGLDPLKETLDKRNKEYEEVHSKYSTLENEYSLIKDGIDKLGTLSKKDFAVFQKHMTIDDQTVLDRAREILRYRDAEDYEKKEMDKTYQAREDQYRSLSEVDYLRKENAEIKNIQHQYAFDKAMSDSDIKEFGKKFDSKLGEKAFENRVREYGRVTWDTKGQYIQPIDACKAVVNEFSVFFKDQENVEKPVPQAPVARVLPKTIPNFGTGATTAPIKKRYKSIDDIRKYGEELARASERYQ